MNNFDPEVVRQARWRLATNRLQVAKLSSLETRLKRYKRERKVFWGIELPLMATLVAVVVFPGCYFLPSLLVPGIALESGWLITAWMIWACVTSVPASAMYPRRPTTEDVDRDRALRRQFGLDDSVAE